MTAPRSRTGPPEQHGEHTENEEATACPHAIR